MGGDRKRIRLGIVLPLALAAVAYVLAGYFVDIPPYAIWLEGSDTVIEIDGSTARVETSLTYACTSWRSRRTSVYLPVSHDHGEGDVGDFRSELEAGSSCTLYPDGALLHLSMSPRSRQVARFRFSQPLAKRAFRYVFSVGRGWSYPANLLRYQVVVPAAVEVRFSIPPERQEKMAGGLRVRYHLSGVEGKELLIEWQ